MDTTFKKRLSYFELTALDSLLNIRSYELIDSHIAIDNDHKIRTYRLTIRHCDEEEGQQVYSHAIKKVRNQLNDYLQKDPYLTIANLETTNDALSALQTVKLLIRLYGKKSKLSALTTNLYRYIAKEEKMTLQQAKRLHQ